MRNAAPTLVSMHRTASFDSDVLQLSEPSALEHVTRKLERAGLLNCIHVTIFDIFDNQECGPSAQW